MAPHVSGAATHRAVSSVKELLSEHVYSLCVRNDTSKPLNFLLMLPVVFAQFSGGVAILCTSGFVDVVVVTFGSSGPSVAICY